MTTEMGKRIVEIGGVKLEVDLRHARVIENFKVGDNVKVLKKSYGDSYASHLGVIIGFDNFKNRPTIVIAYVDEAYNDTGIKMLYLHKDSTDVEICPMSRDEVVIDKGHAIEGFDRKIDAKQIEVNNLKAQKQYFLDKFGQYFEASNAIDKVLNA